MKKVLFSLSALLPTILFAQQNKFSLDGKILSDSTINGYIYISYHPKGTLVTNITDSALIKNNAYHYEGSFIDGAAMVVINWYKRPMKKPAGYNPMTSIFDIGIYINAGEHVYVQHKADFTDVTIKGASVQSQYDSLTHELSLKQHAPDVVMNNFIRRHPESWLSYLVLDQEVRAHMIAPDTSNTLYGLLSPSLKNYAAVQQLGKLVDFYANNNGGNLAGKPAAGFTINDVNDKPVSLSDFKGKYVLVDFWASWCGPCRAENPNVLKAYNEYKDKNFTVIGISLDRGKNEWLQAIKKDGLPWTELCDFKMFQSPAASAYGVEAIPANFLIDPKGNIIATNLRGDALENELTKVLSK